MATGRPLDSIKKIAKNKEDDAIKVLVRQREILASHRHRLDDLKSYYEEYQQHYIKKSSEGTDIQQVNSYRQFLARLREMIALQAQVVEQSQQVLSEKTVVWNERRAHHKGVEKVIKRQQDGASREEMRREQRDADEIAQHITPKPF